MKQIVNIPDNQSRYLCDASINTEAWLESVGDLVSTESEAEWDNDLDVLINILRDHNDSLKYDAEDAEMIAYRCRDNVYNHPNDFDTIFTYSIYTYGDGSDWMWHDTAYVAVCLHRGGDARGNYGAVKVYKLKGSPADSGFFDWCIGWDVVEDSDEGEDLDPDGRYGIGYSSEPTYQLESELAKESEDYPHEWKDGAFHAVLETRNTERPRIKVKCTPYANMGR